MWKKFQKFPLCGLQDMSFQIHKNPFWGLAKNRQLHFTSSHLYEKMPQMVVLLWIFSSSQVSYMLENFQIIWNCTCRKK